MESAPITSQETLFPKTVQKMRCNAGKKRGKLGENDIDVAHRQGYFFEHLGDLYTESGQTLEDSFSAVSKPIFATKYSLE